MSGVVYCAEELLTQRDDLLLVVPAAVHDDASVNQHVAEEEEHLRLLAPAALLHQSALTDQNPTGPDQRLP